MDTSVATPVSGPSWRFSLRHLLIALGGTSVVFAPATYFGSAYLLSVMFSLAVVAICIVVYRATAAGALFVALVGLFFGFVFAIVSVPFALHALLNLLICFALAIARVRPRSFAIGLMVTMLAVYGYVVGSAIGEVRDLIALKAGTPFASLDKRLAFEDESTPPTAPSAQSIQLAADVSKALDEQDQSYDFPWRSRSWALKELHENTAAQFARAAGFGFMRMPSVRAEVIYLRPRPPLKLPVSLVLDISPSSTESIRSLHQRAVNNFVDPERMAYARNRNEVSGFESHGLSSLTGDSCGCKPEQLNWKVTRLELVSLLRHSTPCVYTADSLLAMDKLADVPNRPLNDFEQASLPQLVTQQNIVFRQQPDRIEMLGALRAGNKCLECHQGERGKLLGAFSYTLVPLTTSKENGGAQQAAIDAR